MAQVWLSEGTLACGGPGPSGCLEATGAVAKESLEVTGQRYGVGSELWSRAAGRGQCAPPLHLVASKG